MIIHSWESGSVDFLTIQDEPFKRLRWGVHSRKSSFFSMASTPPSFRNPDTYLNHLSPSKGARFEFNRNFYLSVLGAMIWDILVYIPDDLYILRRDIGMVSLCFVFSRVSTITFLILSVLLYTHPIANCQALDLSTAIVNGLAATCTAALFLRRVQAAYFDNRIVRGVFFCFWLVYVGTLVILPFGLHGTHIRHTNYCITDDKKVFVIPSKVSLLLFDSLVFLAVSYKMPRYGGTSPGLTWDIFVSGKALSPLTREILQSGQQYYLLMVVVNLANIIVLYVEEASAYRTLFTPLSSALGASMACRVYRNIKLFDEKNQSTVPPVVSAVTFARNTSSKTGDCELGGKSYT
ncbi:hypothetical protein BDZ94DRAFT_402587 [Collybia nuda]|uniref:Uncharacterized protein n=1 Tax=Collybia nuda TaxID=64659 RepID=A0A9P6CBR4_9AGAR|nr:hypothetical protein BDZ94DRAFT_402587 [Collybia nuda]